MKARLLIEGAAFGPDALKVMRQAFDQAWADVEHAFTTPELKEAARLCLADILANARNDSRDVEELRLLGHRALIQRHTQEMVQAVKPRP